MNDRRNVYSRLWFSTFLGDVDADIVAPEVAFVEQQLPLGRYRTMLDLCCGPGRHLVPLAVDGYQVVGLDIDSDALDAARGSVQPFHDASFVRGDMRMLPVRTSALDSVICMWQSFGHFDEIGNRDLLAEMARVVRPGGGLLLDVYHREFYERTQGERRIERYGLRVVEQRWMDGNRLHVGLRYEYKVGDERPVGVDEFDWQLYTPDELIAEAEQVGWKLRKVCSGFDESCAPSAERPRMQLVFTAG
ncbi:MAG TPA: class I SAM-dependent methyltransferase [Gemmatimonadaceae bacterium]